MATAGSAPTAAALTIVGQLLGGVPPEPSNLVGTGDVEDVFDAAASLWERAIADPFTVEISYSWSFLGDDGTLAVGLPGSSAQRATQGFISFNNRGVPWYLDPTPNDDSEWSTFSEDFAFLGGSQGNMNVGRTLTGSTGAAAQGFDFFSVAMHEIGHVLGLVFLSSVFATETLDDDIDLTGPLPFAGASLPTTDVGGGHLDLVNALMDPFSQFGIRNLLTEADILAVAQLNDYTQLDLSPARVPEPGTALLCAGGLALLGAVARRPRSAR